MTILGTDLVSNDTDADDEALDVVDPGAIITSTEGVPVTFSNGEFTYDPTAATGQDLEDIQSLSIGSNLTDSFAYTVEDTSGATATATVTVTLTGTEYESDVIPTYGDNVVDVTDLNQVGLYVLGLESPATGNLYQRADAAPRVDSGNGRLSVADWVQTARYILLDPLQSLAGATESALGLNHDASRSLRLREDLPGPSNGVGLELMAEGLTEGKSQEVSVVWSATPGVSAMSFSVAFDPNKLEYLNVALAPGQAGALLMSNDTPARAGRVGFLIAARPGSELDASVPELLTLRFQVRVSGASGLALSDEPTRTKVSDTASRALDFSITPSAIRIESRVPGFDQWTQDFLADSGGEEGGAPIEILPDDLRLEADPDGDGLTNEWEYYLDLSPLQANGSPLKPAVTKSVDGVPESLTVSLAFRSDRMLGECVAEYTHDLVSWTPIEDVVDEDLGDSRRRTTWRVGAAEGAGYVRFRLLRP